MLPIITAAISGVLGLGIGYGIRHRALECDPNALVPSMKVGGQLIKADPGMMLKGAPALPENLPSAFSILQWAGWPGFDNIKVKEGYVSSFNRQTRNPNWVCEHLCEENLNGGGSRPKGEVFLEDISDPPHLRSRLEDYRGSGFDRGHLVAAADIKFSQSAIDETFILSNISPQVGVGFNRGVWERLERWCRNLVKKGEFSDVFIISGPIYLPTKADDGKFYMQHQVLGNPPSVHVPTHFFKVVLGLPTRSAQSSLAIAPAASKTDANSHALVPASSWSSPERPIALGAFVLPNRAVDDSVTDLSKFAVPMEVVERFSGLEFFKFLPKSNAKYVKPLCSATKCNLPPPFQKSDKKDQPPRIVEIK